MIGLPLQAPSLCPSGRAGLFSSPGHRFSTHLYLSQSQCPKRERLKCRDGGLAIAEAPIVVSFQRLSPSPCRIGLGKDNLLPASRAIDHNDAERVCRFSAARGLVDRWSFSAGDPLREHSKSIDFFSKLGVQNSELESCICGLSSYWECKLSEWMKGRECF